MRTEIRIQLINEHGDIDDVVYFEDFIYDDIINNYDKRMKFLEYVETQILEAIDEYEERFSNTQE